jgi:hypothetical protein
MVQMFLYKAADLGMRLSAAFKSATGELAGVLQPCDDFQSGKCQ